MHRPHRRNSHGRSGPQRRDPHGTGGRGLPPPRRAPAGADGRAEHRPDESRWFCRNCLSRWYREAAEGKGIGLADPDAREIVYGMPYKEWQAKYQKEATADQKAAFAKA